MLDTIDEIKPYVRDNISTSSQFFAFAQTLGKPVSLKDGSFIKRLEVTPEESARPNSLSSRYGTGAFPFHTDTSFWESPARLVLLRAVAGDLERPTRFISFSAILGRFPESKVRQAAWLCNTGRRKRFTTMAFGHAEHVGLRYDPNCMEPANFAAHQVDKIIRPRCFTIEGQTINWIKNRVLVLPNWTHLHGRGQSDLNDHSRILERIYIH